MSHLIFIYLPRILLMHTPFFGTVRSTISSCACQLLLLMRGLAITTLFVVSSTTSASFAILYINVEDAAADYEAEDASLSRKFLVSDESKNFTGSGYVDYVGEGSVEWLVNTDEGGEFMLSFRYALRSGSRPLDIEVNGAVVSMNTSFPATGSWDTWGSVERKVILKSGANIIRARTRGRSGPNMDRLEAHSLPTSTAQFSRN
jgi:hypothetical protein